MIIPATALGPVIAAGIAGAVAMLMAVITKEQKISELRHSWMRALEADVGIFVASMAAVQQIFEGPENGLVNDEVRKELVPGNQAGIRVRLLLDVMGEDPTTVRAILQEMITEVSKGRVEPQLYDQLNEKLCNAVSEVLKREWSRVTSGERKFRLITWTGMALSGLALLVLGFAVVERLFSVSL